MKGHPLKNQVARETTHDGAERRILIVSNYFMLRMSLRDLINIEADLAVGGEAADMSEARLLLGRNHLDLALVDRLIWPRMECAPQTVFPENPTLPVVLMTMDNELTRIKIALAAGVRGFVTKHDLATELIPALRDVLRGQRYLSRELLEGIPADKQARILAGEITDWNK